MPPPAASSETSAKANSEPKASSYCPSQSTPFSSSRTSSLRSPSSSSLKKFLIVIFSPEVRVISRSLPTFAVESSSSGPKGSFSALAEVRVIVSSQGTLVTAPLDLSMMPIVLAAMLIYSTKIVTFNPNGYSPRGCSPLSMNSDLNATVGLQTALQCCRHPGAIANHYRLCRTPPFGRHQIVGNPLGYKIITHRIGTPLGQ